MPLPTNLLRGKTAGAGGAMQDTQPTTTREPGAERPRMLIVDDDTTVLRSLSRVLGIDWQVSVAESGREALEVFVSEGPFAVVVTDYRMPGMDGVELISALRELSPATRFVVLTGNQDGDSWQKIRGCEPFCTLAKPSASSEIRDAVLAALECAQRT